MHRKQVIFSLILVILLTGLVSVVALGKGHVPADEVQVCHKGRIVKQLPAAALGGHQAHGDIQLAACSASTGATFQEGADCSSVQDLDGDGRDDAAVTPSTSPACVASGNF